LFVLPLAVAWAGLLPADTAADKAKGPRKSWVYLGTYTGPKSKGIYRCELDLETGKLTPADLVAETTNPSFLAIHPGGRYLYAVGEVDELDGKKKSGGVSAFGIDPETGKLTLLNQKSSGGGGPCHVVIDMAGKHVLVANYSGGNAAVLAVGADGKLGEQTGFAQHKGSSVNKSRQEAPHAHSINLDPANRRAFVADLGLDKVLVYKFDPKKGTLEPNDPPALKTAAGAGPRHFAFHPTGKFAYVINELDSTIDALQYDATTGTLTALQTLSTLPKGYKGNTSTAEVQVHPSGKFVYGSNRGHNSIVAYSVDQKTGKLTYVGHQGAGVKIPRNFGIDPTGKFLLVANQDGDSVVVFRIDQETGALKATGNSIEVPSPVCVKFLAARRRTRKE
jgi:6-phosphogluconolactonase